MPPLHTDGTPLSLAPSQRLGHGWGCTDTMRLSVEAAVQEVTEPQHNGPLSCLPHPGRAWPQPGLGGWGLGPPGQLCHQPDCVSECGGGLCHPSQVRPLCPWRAYPPPPLPWQQLHQQVGRARTFVWQPQDSPATLAPSTLLLTGPDDVGLVSHVEPQLTAFQGFGWQGPVALPSVTRTAGPSTAPSTHP